MPLIAASTVNWNDPRLQPMAYVARGKEGKRELFEVIEVDKTKGVLVENCRTLEVLRVGPREVVPGWLLVKPAPAADASDVRVAA